MSNNNNKNMASSPSPSVAVSMASSNVKTRMLYQVWKGNNVCVLFFVFDLSYVVFSPLYSFIFHSIVVAFIFLWSKSKFWRVIVQIFCRVLKQKGNSFWGIYNGIGEEVDKYCQGNANFWYLIWFLG